MSWELSKTPETDLTRLFDSDIGFPININPLLWKYLVVNLHWHQNSEMNLFGFPKNWNEWIQLESGVNTVVKGEELKWEYQKLFTPFLIQEISAALELLNVHEYCVSCGDYQLARGSVLWEVTLSHPLDETELDLPIVNTSVVLSRQSPQRLRGIEELQNPFSGADATPYPIGVIIEHTDPITAKAIGELALRERYPYAWQKLSSEWQVGITVLHNDQETQSFV